MNCKIVGIDLKMERLIEVEVSKIKVRSGRVASPAVKAFRLPENLR